MAFCTKCGREIPDQTIYCDACRLEEIRKNGVNETDAEHASEEIGSDLPKGLQKFLPLLGFIILASFLICRKVGCENVKQWFRSEPRVDPKNMTLEQLEDHVEENFIKLTKTQLGIDVRGLKMDEVDLYHHQGNEYRGFMSVTYPNGTKDRYDITIIYDREVPSVFYDLGIIGEMRLRAKTQDWW